MVNNGWFIVGYPLVNMQKNDRKSHFFLIEKSTINVPFSIAMLNYQRVKWKIPYHGYCHLMVKIWLTYGKYMINSNNLQIYMIMIND
jgi:hypothetical protein